MTLRTAYLHSIQGDDLTGRIDDATRPYRTQVACMRALLPFIPDAENCTRILDISGKPKPTPEPEPVEAEAAPEAA